MPSCSNTNVCYLSRDTCAAWTLASLSWHTEPFV